MAQDVWDDRWDQCWPLLIGYLPSKDLLSLSLCSRSIMIRLHSTRGWWQQACMDCLHWPLSHDLVATSKEHARSLHTEFQERDLQARQVLLHTTAIAHIIKQSRAAPPQTIPIPPWLPGQPGRARGFVRVQPSSLDPPLLLTTTQLSWLAHGSLSGHTAGVFISGCSSSPRSQEPCAYLAAVVRNKALLAEMYIPRNATLPDPWSGLLSLQPDQHCSSSSSSDTEPFEMWLSSAVRLEAPRVDTAESSRSGSAGSRRSRRGHRRAHTASTAASSDAEAAGISWATLHQLIMKCVADNASRCRAVCGSTVLPPGTSTAAAVERHLEQLLAADGPVLDLRRLNWDQASAEGRQLAATAMQQQQQQQRSKETRAGAALTSQQRSCRWSEDGPWACRYVQQQQPPYRCQGSACEPTDAGHSCTSADAGAGALTAPVLHSGWGWQAAAYRSLQAALAMVHADALLRQAREQLQAASSSGSSAGLPPTNSEDERPELLAALLERLPEAVPDVQLLVLPVLLPAGRAAQRVPSSGGSRLSAPKLLCLNVPFLMVLRKCVWEQLPHLRQAVLMGPVPVLSAPSSSSSAAALLHMPLTEHQPLLPAPKVFSGREVAGTFTAQDLEQHWQHQLQLDPMLTGLPQVTWGSDQQDQWFEQQVAEQRSRRALTGHTDSRCMISTGSAHSVYLLEAGSRAPANCTSSSASMCTGSPASDHHQRSCLSKAAVDALHDMVHSCMDRLC